MPKVSEAKKPRFSEPIPIRVADHVGGTLLASGSSASYSPATIRATHYRTAHNLPHGEVDAVETANWVPKLMRKGTSPSP
jgi:hypothetical protein